MRAPSTTELAAAAGRAAASAAAIVAPGAAALRGSSRVRAIAWACVVALGCDGAGSDTAVRDGAASERAAVQQPLAPAAAVTAPLQRGPVIGGQLVPRAVQWPAAAAVDLAARDPLPAPSRAHLAAAPAPVLAPSAQLPSAAAWATLELHSGPAWWSLVAQRDDVRAVISASTAARLHAGLAGDVAAARPNTRARGGPATSSVNEGIRVLSWFERGVAMSAELECPRPDHAACADDRALRELVEDLALVGGGPLERELPPFPQPGADE